MGTTEQQTSLDREFVEDFARRYEEAWASRDPDQLAELCTEDVVWNDPALREPLRGRDGVRRFVRASFEMAPDFHVESTDAPYIASTGPRVLQPYRMAGTMTGPWEFLDMAPTGRPFCVEGVDSWEMRDGLIARYDTYWDTNGMARQLGALPELGTRGEAAMVRLQHVQARFQRRFAR
jgi:steroid delta-isomerase-like uncharacterized protein